MRDEKQSEEPTINPLGLLGKPIPLNLVKTVATICERHFMEKYIDSLPPELNTVEMAKNTIHVNKKNEFRIRNRVSIDDYFIHPARKTDEKN